MAEKSLVVASQHPQQHSADVPSLIADGGKPAQNAWYDFFEGRIANPKTRRAYVTAVRQFLDWCEGHGLAIHEIMAGDVGKYLSQHHGSLPTKKQHLSAIRRFFNLLVERHICLVNPALVAETERYEVVEGKTPKISAPQIKALLRSIPTDSPIDARDRAAVSIMIYTAARAGAVSRLNLSDYTGVAGERRLRFSEKGGKSREIAVRHDLEKTIDHYLAIAEIDAKNKGPLFRAARRREKKLSLSRLRENDMCRMVKRRMKRAGLPLELSAHSFRVATITDLIGQGIPIEDVQHLAGHKDARTTKLYDRTNRKVTRNLVERISFSQ